MTLALYVTPGGFPVLERGGVPIRFTEMQTRALAMLATDPDRWWQTDELVDQLWGSVLSSPSYDRKLVAIHVLGIRRHAGAEVIETGERQVCRGVGGGGGLPRGYRIGRAVRVIRCEPGATPAGEAA